MAKAHESAAVRGRARSGQSLLLSTGVSGESDWGVGVFGYSQHSFAGLFSGDVRVTGSVIKAGGSFKIDHPLDPANRYLSHSFVESPDMMNVYNGIALLDKDGNATVALPEYFEALNRDFRYQLTCLGAFAPVYVAAKVVENTFRIAGGTPGLEVSWQVTGIRQDAWANANRIPVDEIKPPAEKGQYLHPSELGKPAKSEANSQRSHGQ